MSFKSAEENFASVSGQLRTVLISFSRCYTSWNIFIQNIDNLFLQKYKLLVLLSIVKYKKPKYSASVNEIISMQYSIYLNVWCIRVVLIWPKKFFILFFPVSPLKNVPLQSKTNEKKFEWKIIIFKGSSRLLKLSNFI